MSPAMRTEEEIRRRMEDIKKLNRGWYWLVCVLFVVTSVAALITSVRVLLIFFREIG